MTDLDLDRLRSVAGTDDVEVLREPLDAVVVVHATENPLRPRAIVRIGGMYLVETAEEPDTWYMGQLSGGRIVCHGAYGRLDDALRAL